VAAVRLPVLASIVLAAALASACGGGQAGKPDQMPAADAASPAAAADSAVTRGKYLVDTSGCNDCHTPWKMGPNGPEPDMSQFLTGHPAGLAMPEPAKLSGPWLWQGAATNTAFAGPWGVSYAINLTPDEETGIGLWPEQVFVNAIKTGRHMGVGRAILPPMPWPAYRNMNDDDLKAVYAFLKSLPARKNQVPDAVVAEPPPAATPAPAAPPAS
jgi:mono/diheme cytochrome c family protein